jgi:aldehyde dehydrogenase (NAD+)
MVWARVCGPATCSARTWCARELRAGMVWINSYKRVSPGSPFGGVGASGYGREMGFEAMREYTQPKSVWVNVDAQMPPYYPR